MTHTHLAVDREESSFLACLDALSEMAATQGTLHIHVYVNEGQGYESEQHYTEIFNKTSINSIGRKYYHSMQQIFQWLMYLYHGKNSPITQIEI